MLSLQVPQKIIIQTSLVGGLKPSEKYGSSIGMMTFPISGKITFMFQSPPTKHHAFPVHPVHPVHHQPPTSCSRDPPSADEPGASSMLRKTWLGSLPKNWTSSVMFWDDHDFPMIFPSFFRDFPMIFPSIYWDDHHVPISFP